MGVHKRVHWCHLGFWDTDMLASRQVSQWSESCCTLSECMHVIFLTLQSDLSDASKVWVMDMRHLQSYWHLMLHEENRLAMQQGHPDKCSPYLHKMQEEKQSGPHSFRGSIGMR